MRAAEAPLDGTEMRETMHTMHRSVNVQPMWIRLEVG